MDFKPHAGAIRAFLEQARESRVTDLSTHAELISYLETRTAEHAQPEEPVTHEPIAVVPPPPPPPVRSAPAPRPQPRPRPEPKPMAPPPPPEPGELARRWAAIREAVVSDLSLHGFAYLGVLVIFASVLGLLLFAFADVPDAHQPVYELVMAFIFFAFAWYLRRQHAIYVARAMELIGGMALPLVLFAGLVDNAPFPPDFQGTGLVVALTVTALSVSVGYAVWSARHPDSMLGHLVAPLWWLAALTLGFIFKTDEPLVSDAITRLVSQQPALASAAVAATVLWATVQPGARLASRSRTAVYVGAPVAYLLTLSLAAGEGWANTWPLFLAGAATFLSVELMARHLEESDWVVTLRPFLVAALVAPLFPSLDTAAAGVLVVAVYTALFEWIARTTPSETTALTLSRAGMGLGAVMTLEDPWAALVVFSLISVWAHVRRARLVGDESQLVYVVAAAGAPVGVGIALTQLIGGTTSWAVMALVLVALATATRFTARDDAFWAWWPPGATILVVAGAIASGTPSPDVWRIVALGAGAATIAVGAKRPMGRLWGAAAIAVLAVTEAGTYLADPVIGTALLFAGLGLVAVSIAALVVRPASGHLAAVGHLLAGVSLLAPHSDLSLAAVAGAWAVGWLITTGASSREAESFRALLSRILGKPGSDIAELSAPLVSAASLPVAFVLVLRLWPAFANDPQWVGATLAILAVAYAVAARRLTRLKSLQLVAAGGSVLLMVLAPAWSVPDRLPLIVSLASGVAVAALLRSILGSRILNGYGWASGYGLVILVVEQAGVATQHLDRVALIVGLTGVISSLVADDLFAGRREPGQGLRVAWLDQPLIIGVVAAVAGLIFQLSELPDSASWVIAAGAATVAIAYLARVGLLSGLGYLLAASGIVALDPLYWLNEPWRLVMLAAPLVAAAIVSHRFQPEPSPDIRRWDLPALVVAHVIAGIAVLAALVEGEVMVTALVFAALSLALGVAYRNQVWLEAGNVLLVVAAFDAGKGWLALILAITAIRGAITAYYTDGVTRTASHVLGGVSGGLGWVVFLSWLDLRLDTAIDLSLLVAPGFTLLTAGAGRIGYIRADTVRIWGSTGIAVVSWATAVTLMTDVSGPAPAIGLAVLAAALEISHPQTHRLARFSAVPMAGLSWLFLVSGSGWSGELATGLTAVVFGTVAIAATETVRRIGGDESGLAEAWGGLAFVAVAAATMNAWLLGAESAGYMAAAGVALLGFGTARAATPLSFPALRATAAVLWLTSLLTAAVTADWPTERLALATALVGAFSTFAYLGLWVRGQAESWNRPLTTMAMVANVVAGLMVLGVWPAQALTVTITLSLAAQAIAVGVYRARPTILAFAPPLAATAFFAALGEGLARNALWYTVPLAIVALSELEILRHVRRHAGKRVDTAATLTVEVLGLALAVMPALVSMFRQGLGYAGVALAIAAACLIWAGVSRVKRRVIAAGAIALATTVLSIVAAAAGSAPDTVAFWVTGAGIGVAVMLVAGFVEAYRSRKGQLMARLDQVTQGWD